MGDAVGRRDKGPPSPEPDALAFVVRWSRTVRAILVRDEHVPFQDVDDITQEVLLVAWDAIRRGRFDPTHAPGVRAWLRVVAHRSANDARRRREREPTTDREAVQRSDEAPLLARDLLRALERATTPQRWRAFLAVFEGVTLTAFARSEGIPTSTAHGHAAQARRDFAAAIRKLRARERRGPR